MKKWSLLMSLLLCMVVVTGCRGGDGQKNGNSGTGKTDEKAGVRHFAAAGISFDYPEGWKSFSEIFPWSKLQSDPELDAETLTRVAYTGSSTRFEKIQHRSRSRGERYRGL